MITRKVLLAGASGLVGSHILQLLLLDDSVSEIHVLARRGLSFQHEKIKLHLVNFSVLPNLPKVDEIYLALGTTIKQAGSREAFEAIDLEANLAIARAGFAAGAKRLGLVSAMGASSDSMLFYNRIKGQLEDQLATIPFVSLVIARPSFLLGNREELNQPKRYAESVGIFLFKFLNPLLPRNLRAVDAFKVALSLVTLTPNNSGRKILQSGEIQAYGEQN